MSSFNGINTALTALRTQRQGLELAGQNIANAGTEGYTRQRLETSSIGGSPVAAFWSTPNKFSTGQGVQVTSVNRLQDAYMDARVRSEHERKAATDTNHDVLVDVERVYNEPSDNGLQAQLTDLWSGFADVADNPGDLGSRTQLLTRAQSVAGTLNAASAELAGQYTERRTQLVNNVNDINAAAKQLASLNEAVVRAKAAGVSANELSDQRDTAALKLTELTGGQLTRGADDSITITLGGSNLVSGSTSRDLKVTNGADIASAGADPVTLKWVDTDTVATGAGGKAGALLNGLNTVLPDQLARFDKVANALTTTINTANAAGFTKAGAAGGALMSGTTAATIKVATTNPADIAASASGTQALGGGNADAMARLGSKSGGADEVYRTNVADIGMRVRAAEQAATTQGTITNQVDSARSATSGVNLDEELTSMITYQRSYEAAAKVMSTVDSMLDTLINRMGV
ncbi:flagellar hook-associated protein FlgK [Actinokineospora globicatena]|uniref:flagellar hook-associated protein FlgK n=1 Tax=Actinokineospora globicatena TaxID=103729 RepID=UPI0020A5D641|nr:flagellar hook-associated protein FlgK [Actinokineospora globicatena]MCP2306237.1 flagellar hook-associated protein 1 FlgK [Actinokineospora globicatena]GLW81663.1 flagellar hook-associated protein 1 [Actinokineospora globicatena]GLW88457.1 flagellar hook-associated protein 1 [Actinokineospora globicatena]